ncbi:hypothetical protein PAMP_023612 [Pampus punctatissimus]
MRRLCYFFLFILAQVHSSNFNVIGFIGHNVTLPCKYDTQTYGVLGFCWGREYVPLSKCSNTIVSSPDGALPSIRDPKYQLLGSVMDGELSLTILNAQWSDAGLYSCRVEIPGPFNDYKANTYLAMEEASVEQPVTQSYLLFTGYLQDCAQGCVYARNVAQMASVGTDVTLTCSYDAKWYGRLSVCWGRGPIPNSGCNNEVIKSDGTSVTSRLSERYLLMGNSGKGDVSLTIRQVEESDSGVYGCRVEIPGWFNDQKHEMTLTVIPVRPNSPTVKTLEVKERTITVRWSPVFNGGRAITSYMIDVKKKQAPWDITKRTTVSHELTQVTLVDLRPAVNYNLRVFAVNSVGMSEASNVLTFITKEGAPEGPPLDMKLEALSSENIRVTWKPPRSDLRNGVLRSYSIGYKEYALTGRQWKYQTVAATQELESFILSNLKPSTMYSVLIQAKTSAGTGPASTALHCQTMNETSWDYTKTVVDFSPNQTEATIIETNPSTYNIRMFAVTSLGTSKASNVLTITTGETGVVFLYPWMCVNVQESQSGHLVAVVVPVVLVLLIVAIVMIWQLRRIKQRKGSLNMWLTNGTIRYTASDTLQEVNRQVNLKIHLTLRREQTEKCFLEGKNKVF